MRLSSRYTVIWKFVIPILLPLGYAPFFLIGLRKGPPDDLRVYLGMLVIAALAVWARPLKRVRLEGDRFFISNYLREISVPASTLMETQESYGRTSTITLRFEPPTRFGALVVIIPPLSYWTDSKFDEVALFLRGIAAQNRGPEPPPVDWGSSAAVTHILAHPGADHEAAVEALHDAELDALIDRLPCDGELRELARRERQRRWYG
jgi:hypothetical protein